MTKGNYNKICDQISGMLIDSYFAQDCDSRIVCEVMNTKGLVVIIGNIPRYGLIKQNSEENPVYLFTLKRYFLIINKKSNILSQLIFKDFLATNKNLYYIISTAYYLFH